jgi:hypothetical protein
VAALVTQLEMQVSRPVLVAVVEDTSAHETVTSRAMALANMVVNGSMSSERNPYSRQVGAVYEENWCMRMG